MVSDSDRQDYNWLVFFLFIYLFIFACSLLLNFRHAYPFLSCCGWRAQNKCVHLESVATFVFCNKYPRVSLECCILLVKNSDRQNRSRLRRPRASSLNFVVSQVNCVLTCGYAFWRVVRHPGVLGVFFVVEGLVKLIFMKKLLPTHKTKQKHFWSFVWLFVCLLRNHGHVDCLFGNFTGVPVLQQWLQLNTRVANERLAQHHIVDWCQGSWHW